MENKKYMNPNKNINRTFVASIRSVLSGLDLTWPHHCDDDEVETKLKDS